MSDFQLQVEQVRDKAIKVLRNWDKQKAAREVMREYLSEEGLVVKSGSKLEELLETRHRMAIDEKIEPDIRLKAINASLEMAAGNEKVTNVQNNQYNFGDFLRGLKDD